MHCYDEQNVWFFEIQQATANINKLSWKVDFAVQRNIFLSLKHTANEAFSFNQTSKIVNGKFTN